MKPENLIIGKSYRYTNQYLDEYSNEQNSFKFFSREDFANILFVYQGIDADNRFVFSSDYLADFMSNIKFYLDELTILEELPQY